MRVGLLGPLTVDGESGEIVLSAAKERSLLAALALSPGVVVGADGLVGALWGDTPPASARKTLQTYVSNLRRVLGAELVVTDPAGYSLQVAPDDVDVVRFRSLAHAGEAALRDGAIPRARELLSGAVELWRGEPFPGVGPHTGLAAEGVRLREEYLGALESRVAAELAGGRQAELVGELEALVREHPFRERLWGHLMVALYRGGRQADALAAYQRARALLRDELGLEPGGELQRLERAVLDQDPSLDAVAMVEATRGKARDHAVARPPVRYAVCRDGVHVAYRVVGDGPIDILAVPGFVSHLDIWWDAPTDQLVRRLASLGRLILFDKRGMGLSDRPQHIDLEHWVEDALAVLDAVGSERAVILGISAGSPTAAMLSALHPERTRALILWGGYPRFLAGDGYEHGYERDVADSFIAHLEANWGTGVGISTLAPSRAHDPFAREYWARYQTISASPGAAAAFLRALSLIDVRHALSAISAPTLILHATRDRNIPVEAARLSHELIRDSVLVELDSDIHLIWLSDVVDGATSAIESFLARTLPAAAADRVLATVLAIGPGDLDEDERAALADIIARHRGEPLRATAGASFDAPARAIRCGRALVTELALARRGAGVAVHSGECERTPDGVRGVAVDVAVQLAAGAVAGELLVSQTIRDLVVGSEVCLEPRGRRAFAGVPGEWDVFRVADAVR